MANKTLDLTAKGGIVVDDELVDRWDDDAQRGHFHGKGGKVTAHASVWTATHLRRAQRGALCVPTTDGNAI